MGKKKNPNADLRLPDRKVEPNHDQHVHFDDEYFRSFRRAHIEQNGATEVEKAALIEGCEYSQPRDNMAMLRDCALCKMKCGEQGWRYHYEQCDLRKRALRDKEKQEQKKGI